MIHEQGDVESFELCELSQKKFNMGVACNTHPRTRLVQMRNTTSSS